MKQILKFKRKNKLPVLEVGQDAVVRLRAAAIDTLLTDEEELSILSKSGEVFSIRFDQIQSLSISVPNHYRERVELLHGEKVS